MVHNEFLINMNWRQGHNLPNNDHLYDSPPHLKPLIIFVAYSNLKKGQSVRRGEAIDKADTQLDLKTKMNFKCRINTSYRNSKNKYFVARGTLL